MKDKYKSFEKAAILVVNILSVNPQSSQITASNVRDILGSQRPELCYNCMKCTSGCPAAKVSEYRPHLVVALTKAGAVDELVKSGLIWACSMCLKCKEYCPQEVSPYETVVALKNIATKKNISPPELIIDMSNTIVDKGRIMDPMMVMSRDFEEFSRKELGLPEIPTPKDLEKFKKNLKKIGLEKMEKK